MTAVKIKNCSSKSLSILWVHLGALKLSPAGLEAMVRRLTRLLAVQPQTLTGPLTPLTHMVHHNMHFGVLLKVDLGLIDP